MIKLFWAFRALVYSVICKKIGFLSYIGKPLFISGFRRITIGNRVRIYPGCRIEVIGKFKKKKNVNAEIIIEDNVSIGQNFHVTAMDRLCIKRDTTISGNVFITNIDHDYRNIDTHIMDQELLYSKTEIGENCLIGFGARIQAGTILGKHCVVGTNAVVRGVFPDYSVIVGVPARIIKRYNANTKKWERTTNQGEFLS